MTGPSDATKAIVVIYDIFGYFDQTVQGADILAFSDEQKYKVFIPDWFKGNPCPIEWYVGRRRIMVLYAYQLVQVPSEHGAEAEGPRRLLWNQPPSQDCWSRPGLCRGSARNKL